MDDIVTFLLIMAELSWLLHFDCRLHSESDTRNISAGFKQTVERASSPLQYAHEYIYFTAETLRSISRRFCTNTEAGIIILTRKAICFRTERDTTLLWSIDYIVWQAGCIAWWIVSHYISSLSLSELLVPLHRAELNTAGQQTTAHRHRILNVERNNVALFNYWNAVLNICVRPLY